MNRLWRYVKTGIRWYLSPSGLLFGLSVALLAAGLLPVDRSWILTLAGLILFAVFVPYRFSRQQNRGDGQISRLQKRFVGSQDNVERLRSRITEVSRMAGESKDQAARAKSDADEAAQTARRVRRDLAERVAMAERGLADRMASYRAETRSQLQSVANELRSIVNERLEGDRQRRDDREKELVESLDRIASTVETLRIGLDETRTSQRDLVGEVADERSRRIIGFARRDSSGSIPPRVALIVAVPRTGSTWSYDMLRTMPSVYVEPSLLVWERLGLEGRRYPAGLSDSASASIDVEVAPGVGAELDALVENRSTTPSIAVEKLHPEFFGFSPMTLEHAIRRLESDPARSTVVPIYQVRNPIEAMWSFARYKQRDEAWYRHISMEGIPSFMRRTFESLEELMAIRPGFIVDFRDLQVDESVARLFAYADPSISADEAAGLVERARLATKRDLRLKQQRRPFLGDRMSTSSGNVDGPAGAWVDAQDDIEECRKVYERLLSQRSTGATADGG